MRTEITTREIAKYEELTQDQKTKALDNLDLSGDLEFQAESTLEHYTLVLGLLGFTNVNFSYSGFSSQGDGASFTAKFNVPKTVKELKQRVKAAKQEMPSLDLSWFESIRFSKDDALRDLEIYRTNNRYVHSNTVTSDNRDLLECARLIMDKVYRDLERDYEYVCSNEYKVDAIEANEWEFYTDTLTIA